MWMSVDDISAFVILTSLLSGSYPTTAQDADTVICGGFVQSEYPLDYSKVEVRLLDINGNLKYQAGCSANNGNYEVPIFDKRGDFILSVYAPSGISFEPEQLQLQIDGKTDPCSKQENLNFRFAGFSCAGRIQSAGSAEGPADVTVKLYDSKDKMIASTTSEAGGRYQIKKLLPGTYTLEATHPQVQLVQPKVPVVVAHENLEIPDQSLVVNGYSLSGNVKSSGEPIGGVSFLLYSKTAMPSDVGGCEKPMLKENHAEVGNLQHGILLCSVKSDASGRFTFRSLASSRYTLVPQYNRGNREYDIEPAPQEFTINHEPLEVPKMFKVKGLTAYGSVLTCKNGQRVPSAEVYIKNTLATRTNKNSKFQCADADFTVIKADDVCHRKIDSRENYSLGPVAPSSLKDIVVEKRGYQLHRVEGTNNLKTAKLSQIRIQILDSNGKPVSGVLVSISSTAGIRTSNLTDATGTISFVSFAPGKYVIRPMVKEYKFDPSSKSITLTQGQTAEVSWKGVRIAYGALGKVGSFGGDPEVGLVMEAVSKTPCPQMQEECVTGNDGHFRISDLKAGCDYEVRAKTGELGRFDIKWISPANRTIKMGTDNIVGLSFLAFRGFNEAEFTGRIETTKEFLPTLKVCFYRTDEAQQCVSFSCHPTMLLNIPLVFIVSALFLKRDAIRRAFTEVWLRNKRRTNEPAHQEKSLSTKSKKREKERMDQEALEEMDSALERNDVVQAVRVVLRVASERTVVYLLESVEVNEVFTGTHTLSTAEVLSLLEVLLVNLENRPDLKLRFLEEGLIVLTVATLNAQAINHAKIVLQKLDLKVQNYHRDPERYGYRVLQQNANLLLGQIMRVRVPKEFPVPEGLWKVVKAIVRTVLAIVVVAFLHRFYTVYHKLEYPEPSWREVRVMNDKYTLALFISSILAIAVH